jgi:two-component system, NarL family, sensor kinase
VPGFVTFAETPGMKFGKWFPVFLLVHLLAWAAYGQSPSIDKARQAVYSAATDNERVTALVAMGRFANSLASDTIRHYALLLQALAGQLKDSKRQALAAYCLLTGQLVKGKTDSVIHQIDNNSVFKNMKMHDTLLYYKLQLLKANALNRLNNRVAALELQLKILGEAEKEGNTSTQLYALNYIGATYLNIHKPAEARNTWLQAMELIEKLNNPVNKEIEATILSNLALYHFNQYATFRTPPYIDSFSSTINQTIALAEQAESLGILASSYTLRGNFQGLINQFDKGEQDFHKGIAIRKKIGDPLYILSDYTGYASFLRSQQKYGQCIAKAREGIEFANKNGIRGEQVQLLMIMAGASKSTGDFKQYSSILEEYMVAAGESVQLNAAEKIADIQTKYEVQKKEKLIAEQQLSLLRRKVMLYSAAALIVLTLVFIAYRFKKYQREQKVKLVAIMEEEKLRQEEAAQLASEKERKRIASELHDNLGVQANAILHNSGLLQPEEESSRQIVNNLQETARQMLLNLRETLWAMKSADVNAIDLWLRIINFMKQMGRYYTGIQFKLAGEAPPDFSIESSRALHIVLVLQESVSNSVKHAGASMITATSIAMANRWDIRIEDNGMGFDPGIASGNQEAYGLSNMQQRAKDGNFECITSSVANKGTVTLISISN